MNIRGNGMMPLSDRKAKIHRPLRSARVLLSCCLSAVLLTGTAYAGAELGPSENARSMTGVELYMLYRDKSWTWADGAGRFDDQGRLFSARTGAGDTTAWAQGRWNVTNDGHLCLNAEWHTVSGVHTNRTCFIHKLDRGAIYQKKEPSGNWYVFKHAVPVETDEFKKLVAENLVSPDLATIKTNLEIQKKLAGNAAPSVASRRKTQ